MNKKRGNPTFDKQKNLSKIYGPLSVRLPDKETEILLELSDRSERLRAWIIKGMQEEGLL